MCLGFVCAGGVDEAGVGLDQAVLAGGRGSLSRTLESRTSDRITPRLQAFSDASQSLAAAKTRRELLEATLRQWDQVEDLENAVDQLRVERERTRAEIARERHDLAERKGRIIAELSEEFASTVAAIRVPIVRTAAIDPDKYLPVINGQIYYRVVQLGGGVATAIQVAYWSSVLAVALRNRDTDYPAFLLLDSLRLALNTADTLTSALYSRLVAQADANQGRVQFIVADNQLPVEYRSHYAQIDFTYDEPTISSIDHPGEGLVPTIGDPS